MRQQHAARPALPHAGEKLASLLLHRPARSKATHQTSTPSHAITLKFGVETRKDSKKTKVTQAVLVAQLTPLKLGVAGQEAPAPKDLDTLPPLDVSGWAPPEIAAAGRERRGADICRQRRTCWSSRHRLGRRSTHPCFNIGECTFLHRKGYHTSPFHSTRTRIAKFLGKSKWRVECRLPLPSTISCQRYRCAKWRELDVTPPCVLFSFSLPTRLTLIFPSVACTAQDLS